MYPQTATEHYLAQKRLSALTVAASRRLWARLGTGDFDAAWRTIGPQLTSLVSASQLVAAQSAISYTENVLAELNLDAPAVAQVAPAPFAGVASSGAPLTDVLYNAVSATRGALGTGADMATAQASGRSLLDGIVDTQIADAGRAAESVATTVRPVITGYVRMLVLPSCARCAVLAGRFYRWNDGFLRHPRCDCRHIPSTEDIADDMTTDPLKAFESGQVTGLSKADRQAVADGADMGRVVNAQRGGLTTEVGGRSLKTTTAGFRGQQRGRSKPIRLRPDAIYKLADGNRDEALRLLNLHGYTTDARRRVVTARPKRTPTAEPVPGKSYGRVPIDSTLLDQVEPEMADFLRFAQDTYGERFVMHDWSDNVRGHVADLARVPREVHTRVAAFIAGKGKGGIFLGDSTMPGLDNLQHLAGDAPRGWPPGKTWDVVPGAYDPPSVTLAIGKGEHGSESLALHEFGHLADEAYRRSYYPDSDLPDEYPSIVPHSASMPFATAYDAAVRRATGYIRPYYLQSGSAGRSEMWAEASAARWSGNPAALRKLVGSDEGAEILDAYLARIYGG